MAENQDSRSTTADILVVDDTIASLRLLTEILKRAGYQVRPADGPQVALMSALAHPPSLILLDVRMPEMDGFEVSRRLKKDKRTCDVPVIFVSALQDVEDKVQGFEAGGVDFVSKPFQESEVLARVDTHLRLRRMQLHLEELVAERTAELVQANETLRESEERYRSVVQDTPVMLCTFKELGKIEFVNQAYCDYFGYQIEDLVGTSFLALISEEDREGTKAAIAALTPEKPVQSYEHRAIAHDGQIRWQRWTNRAIFDEMGRVMTYQAFGEDITERKWMEEQYRSFFTENVSPVFWAEMKEPIPVDLPVEEQVDAIFREAYVKDVSDATAAMYGLTREELLGEMIAPLAAAESLDRNSALHQYYQRFVRSGYVAHSSEIQERTADGRDLWLLMSIKGIVEDGHLVRIWGSQIDITKRRKAQNALRESEARYRSLFDQAQDGIVVIQDGKIRLANSYLAELSGRAVEELIGMPFETYLAPDELPKAMDMYRRRMQGEAVPPIYESAIQHRDGSRVEVEFNVGPTTYDRKPASLTMVRDIRERVRVERELEVGRRLLNLIIDSIPAQVAYVDNHQRYRFVNQRFEQAYDLPRSEFFGMQVRELLGPEGYAAAEGHITAALAGDPVSYEGLFDHPDRKARWLRLDYVPDREPAGDVHGFVGMITDITERKQAEEELRRSKERLEEAQRTAQIGDWEYDILAGKTTWSAEVYRIFGLDPDTYVPNSKSDEGLCHPDDTEALRRAFDEFFASGEPMDLDYRIATPKGTFKFIRRRGRLILDEQGTPSLAIGTTEDITERKEAEQRVLEYQHRLQALASQLTLAEERERRRIARELHDEVGQRLTFARMGLASARETASDAQREAILGDVSQAVRQAIGDIRDLIFDLSSPLMDEVGLAAALEEWMEEQVGKKYGLQTEFVHDGQRPHLDDDVRAILFRSVRELLTNVVKHAQATRVLVRLEGEGALVRIVVEDDGIGCDVDALPRAMEREDGFGLFSIQERMADLGGSLEIATEPGKGCKAVLTAPTAIQ